MKTIFSFVILPLIIWADSNLNYSSPNLCARQSVLPAKSVYLFLDGFGPGRSATKWAREAGVDKVELVTSTWQKLHARGFYLSKRILELLIDGDLPILNPQQLKACGTRMDCPEYKKIIDSVKGKILSESNSTAVKCTWVKKALPIMHSAKAPNRNDLEDLAVAYLDKANYIDSCEKIFSGDTKNNTDLILKLDLNSPVNWIGEKAQIGFEFWRSFKIYLSLMWGLKWNHPALRDQEIIRSFPVDEIVTLMADGCYSITRPECDTDFLNISQLKSTIKKGGFQNSFLMANEILKTQINGFSDRLNPAPAPAALPVTTDTRSELLSLMKLRHQSNFELYKSVRNLALILNKIPSAQMYSKLYPMMMSESIKPEIYTLCAEIQKAIDSELSPFAKELSISKEKVSGLSQFSISGLRPDELFQKGLAYLETIKPLCHRVDKQLKNKMLSSDSPDWENFEPARSWFQTITRYTLPDELAMGHSQSTASALPSPMPTLVNIQGETICDSIVDCTRDVLEALVHVYQVALYKNVSSSTVANEMTTSRHLGADVACGLFDPWEKSQLRKKNLVSDLVSSVISGVAMLPIYLDLDFDTKSLVSFEQLYESGKIKFDPQFADQSTKTTLFLDLGQLAKAPCYVSVSNTSSLKQSNRALIFQGVSFQGCIQNSSGQITSNVLSMQSSRLNEVSGCGACILNFEEVAVAAATHNYNLFRFGIRFVAALVTYFKEQENPVNQPIELSVNPEYVKETYVKYNSIPDSCMYELVNGSRCMQNICLSYTMSQVEKSWGVKVKDGSLWNSDESAYGGVNSYTDAWLKLEGCEHEVRFPIRCDQGKKPSFVNIPNEVPSCAKGKR